MNTHFFYNFRDSHTLFHILREGPLLKGPIAFYTNRIVWKYLRNYSGHFASVLDNWYSLWANARRTNYEK